MVINMSIYAVICAAILLFLSIRIVLLRRKYRVGLGDGDHWELRQAIRAHGNFIEYSSFFLILLMIMELIHGNLILLNVLGIAFIIGRVSHAYSIIKAEKYENGALRSHVWFRTLGMVLTFTCIFIAAVYIAMVWLGAVTAPV